MFILFILRWSINESFCICFIANLILLQSFNETKTTVLTKCYWSHHFFVCLFNLSVAHPSLWSKPKLFAIQPTHLPSSFLLFCFSIQFLYWDQASDRQMHFPEVGSISTLPDKKWFVCSPVWLSLSERPLARLLSPSSPSSSSSCFY